MGFWQGVNEGLTYSLEKRAREKELADAKAERQYERDLAKKQREEDRVFEREMFQQKILESRRDDLFKIAAARAKSQGEVSQFVGKAQALVSRFPGMEDDPRVAALMQNPMAAAQLEDTFREIEKKRAENDLDLPPLMGATALDLITVQTPEGNFAPVSLSPEDILAMDMSDRAAYEGAMIELQRTPPGLDVTVSPEAYRMTNPKVLEEGRAAFDQEVLRAATQALNAASENPEAFTRLRTLLEDAGKENSPGMIALRDMFGAQALSSLQGMDSPYIQNLEKDPQLKRYFAILELSRIASDPTATEDERTRAGELMRRLQGGV